MLSSAGPAVFTISGAATNSGEMGAVSGNLSFTSSSLTNSGTLAGGGAAQVTTTGAAGLTNSAGGSIQALGGALSVATADLTNAGQLYGGNGLALSVPGSVSNSGTIEAASGNLSIGGATAGSATTSLVNTDGLIQADAGSLTINAGTLQNIQDAGSQADLIGTAAVGISVSGDVTNSGVIGSSGGATTLSAATLSNTGQISSGTNSTLTTAGDLTNSGLIYATNNVTLAVGGTLDNTGGQIGTGVNDVTIGGATAGSALTSLINVNGLVAANAGTVTLTTASIANIGGTISANTLSLNLSGDYAENGTLSANSGLSITLPGALTVGSSGVVSSIGAISLNASSLTNNGAINAGGTLTLTLSGSVTNNGALTSLGSIVTQIAGDLYNTGGIIGGTGISLGVDGTLTNQMGAILAESGDITIGGRAAGSYSTAVINNSGLIQASTGSITISADTLTNQIVGGVTLSGGTGPTIAESNPLTGVGIDGVATVTDPLTGGPGLSISGVDGLPGTPLTITATGQVATAVNAASLISAGNNLTINGGSITNDASHIVAGGAITMTGGSLNNIGYPGGVVTYVLNIPYLRTPTADDIIISALPGAVHPLDRDISVAAPAGSGAHTLTILNVTWFSAGGSLNGTIVAGGDFSGTFTGQVDNTTIIAHGTPASVPDYSGFVPTVSNPGGVYTVTANAPGTTSTSGASGLSSGAITGVGGSGAAGLTAATLNGTTTVTADTLSRGTVAPVAAGGTTALTPAVLSQIAANGWIDPLSVIANATQPSAKPGPVTPQTELAQIASFGIAAIPGGSALFVPNPTPGAHYLIETNPLYTNLGNLEGSSYLLTQLKINPNNLPPFLGDSYYDARYVDQQVLDLTGKNYITAANDTDATQMDDLINNAVATASDLNLSVGVALTPAQQASLTQDIVWYVSEVVDGQTVLVPRVYLSAAHEAEVTAGGAVIAAGGSLTLTADGLNTNGTISSGGNLAITSTGAIDNSGSISAVGNASLTSLAGSINNTSTVTTFSSVQSQLGQIASISAGSGLTLKAAQNITGVAATLTAGTDLTLSAGGDVNFAALALDGTSLTFNNPSAGVSSETETQSSTQAGSSLTAGGNLSITSGVDTTLTASSLSAVGNLGVNAGGTLTLDTANNVVTSTTQGTGYYGSDGVLHSQSSDLTVTALGSQVLSSGGAVSLSGGNGVGLLGAYVSAATDASVLAGVTLDPVTGNYTLSNANANVEIANATDYSQSSYSSTQTKDGFLYSRTTDISQNQNSTTAVSSTVSGNTVTVASGGDIGVQGSNIVGTGNVSLTSNGSTTITTAVDTSSQGGSDKVTTTGLFTSGLTLTLGQESTQALLATTNVTNVGSNIGSTNGSLSIAANSTLGVIGSNLSAGQDVALQASSVTIGSALDLSTNSQEQKTNEAGISLGLGGAVGQAITTAYDQATAANNASDPRLKALLATESAYQIATNGPGIGQAALGNVGTKSGQGDLEIELSIGGSGSDSKLTTTTGTVVGSSLNAGGDLSVMATGGDLNVIGSSLNGTNVGLSATNNINLLSAQNWIDSHSTNSSWSASLGVGLGYSSSGFGASVTLEGQENSGHGTGSTVVNTNTQITATNELSLNAGSNITGTGVEASGNSIFAYAGKNLTLTSTQDSDTYNSNQSGIGGSISYTFGAGAVSGSLNLTQQQISSDYQSVNQQTGLYAGSGGFNIAVGNNTQLNGAVISSTADPINNILLTNTFGFTNLTNSASYSAKGLTLSVGTDIGQTIGTDVTSLLGLGNSSGSAGGSTNAAISAGTIVVQNDQNTGQNSLAGLSRDPGNANNAISKIFNLSQVQANLALAQEGANFAGQVGSDIASGKLAGLPAAYQQLAQNLAVAINPPDPDALQQQLIQAGMSAANASVLVPLIVNGTLTLAQALTMPEGTVNALGFLNALTAAGVPTDGSATPDQLVSVAKSTGLMAALMNTNSGAPGTGDLANTGVTDPANNTVILPDQIVTGTYSTTKEVAVLSQYVLQNVGSYLQANPAIGQTLNVAMTAAILATVGPAAGAAKAVLAAGGALGANAAAGMAIPAATQMLGTVIYSAQGDTGDLSAQDSLALGADIALVGAGILTTKFTSALIEASAAAGSTANAAVLTAEAEAAVDAAVAAGANLVGADGELAAAAQRIQPQPGVFDVIVHGDANGFYVQNPDGSWAQVSANNLAQYMRANGYAGEPVRLVSCGTGSCGSTAAQDLSNQLGIAVEAPSDTVWIQPNGALTIGPAPNSNVGKWNTFTPGGNIQ